MRFGDSWGPPRWRQVPAGVARGPYSYCGDDGDCSGGDCSDGGYSDDYSDDYSGDYSDLLLLQ